jgi:hypothetical protein
MTEYSFTHAGHDYEIHAPNAKYYRVTRDGETVADYSGLSAWSIENGWNWRDVCHLFGAAKTSAQNAHLKRLALLEAATYDRLVAENAGGDE